MDGGRGSNNNSAQRDSLLFHSGHAYRLLLLGHRFGGCSHPLKFGSPSLARDFLARFTHTPAMRHRLHLAALYWAAYFGESMGGDDLAWLAKQVFTRRLGLYIVVCGAVPRGVPKKPEEKKPAARETASTVADNLPIIGPIKSALQAIAGVDLVTDEPVSRWGEGIGVIAGLAPGGKVIAKVAGKKVSELLGDNGLVKNQKRTGKPTAAGFVKRHKGPDGMTRDPDRRLTEGEAKGTKDGNTRVATDTKGHKQGSADKNKAYAEKILTKRKKVGKPSKRIGGPYTAQELELWQEVHDNDGRKNHISAHTNTETGQVRVFERDHKGNIVKQTDAFQLDDFEATKKKLIEDFGE